MATCYYCDKEATALCDFMYLNREGLLSEDNRTCDRPMCEDHVAESSNMFFDGDAENTFVDSCDYCPSHAGMGGHEPPFSPIGPKGPGRPNRMAA